MDREKNLEIINQAIKAIDAELSSQSQGHGTVSNPIQLQKFRAYFEKMRNEIENESLSKTSFGISHAIVDSWPLNSALGELLVRAEQAYLT